MSPPGAVPRVPGQDRGPHLVSSSVSPFFAASHICRFSSARSALLRVLVPVAGGGGGLSDARRANGAELIRLFATEFMLHVFRKPAPRIETAELGTIENAETKGIHVLIAATAMLATTDERTIRLKTQSAVSTSQKS
jgi:hypothetical protein